MARENMRHPDNTAQNNTEIEPQEARLTRIVRKINRVNPFSYAPGVGAAAGRFVIHDVEKTASAVRNVELGAMDMLLGALLLGVPAAAIYGTLKMPEWIHAGVKKLEKMGVKISSEVRDVAFLDSLESYVNAKQWVHKNVWRIKEKHA